MSDRDDVATRALHALGPEETRRFDEQADAATRTELDRMREVVAALAAPTAAEPPAALRAQVLAQIAQTAQERADVTATAPAVDATGDAPVTEAAVDATGTSEPTEETAPPAGPRELAARRRWFQRPGSLLAAAAAAAVLLVGGVAIGQSIRTPDPVSALVYAADVQMLSGPMPDGTQATVMWSAEQGDAAIMFDGLATLENEQVYEAWYLRDGQAVSAGIFEGDGGSTVHVFDGAMQAGDAFGITIEPAGGSEQPTSDPILVLAS